MNKKEGISLIVLIITIIVVIILAAAVILTISNNNPISSAKESTFKEDVRNFQNELAMKISEEYVQNQGNRDLKFNADNYDDIKNIIPNFSVKYGNVLAIQNDELVYQTNVKEQVEWCEELGLKSYSIKVTDIFDENGKYPSDKNYNSEKLHISDFVTYDAGNWTEDEINSIRTGIKGSETTANNSNEAPNIGYQFGGFKEGDSRNAEILTSINGSSNHTPHPSISTGWRVFDIDNSKGTITLVSAGCTELYNHPSTAVSGEKYLNYTSIYILTGQPYNGIAGENYDTRRNWNQYVNKNQYAISSSVLDISLINSWYAKYIMNTSSANIHVTDTFNSVFGTQYETIIDNYSTYWLCSTYYGNSMPFIDISSSNNKAFINGGNGINRCGLRVVITLSSDAKVQKNHSKVTLTNRNNEKYTYNMWNLV